MVLEIRRALRRLMLRRPGLSGVVVASLALGFGLNTAMSAVFEAVFLRQPFGVSDPRTVYRVFGLDPSQDSVLTQYRTHEQFERIKGRNPAFAILGAYSVRDVGVEFGNGMGMGTAAVASASLLNLLGISAELGRILLDEDDRPGSAPVAVIAHGVWMDRFGGDPHVLGRSIRIGGSEYVIVGVLTAGFTGVDLHPVDLWVGLGSGAPGLLQADALTSPFAPWFKLVVRTSLSPSAVSRELTRRYNDAEIAGRPSEMRLLLGPLNEGGGPLRREAWSLVLWATGMATTVLLIACLNTSGLLLGDALGRSRETAIRAAIGGGRVRVALPFLIEAGTLAFAGAVLGIILGSIVSRAFLNLFAVAAEVAYVRLCVYGVMGAVIAVALAVVLPFTQAARLNPVAALASGGGEGNGVPRPRLWLALVSCQLAGAVTLSTAAILLLRSASNALAIDPGFDPRSLFLLEVDVGAMPSAAVANRAYDRLLTDLQRTEGLAVATLVAGAPLRAGLTIWPQASEPSAGAATQLGRLTAVGPDFHTTLRSHLLQGRAFGPEDRAGGQRVAVVTAGLARRLWRGENPLGRCIRVSRGDQCRLIVGVTADLAGEALLNETPGRVLIPLEQLEFNAPVTAAVVRASGSRAQAERLLRDLQVRLREDVGYIKVTSYEALIDDQTRHLRATALSLGIQAGIAILLAMLGVYGMLAHSLAMRTHEFGVRAALGAPPMALARLVARDGLRAILVGGTMGTVAAYFVAEYLAPHLYAATPRKGESIVLAIGLVAAAAICGCIVPATRAMFVAPMEVIPRV